MVLTRISTMVTTKARTTISSREKGSDSNGYHYRGIPNLFLQA